MHLAHTNLIVLIRIPLPLLHNLLTKPTTSRIELLAILIPNLPSTLAATILPPLRKTLIKITADYALVQLRAADVLHAVQRVLMRVVLDKTEAAGRFVEAVQAHDQALDAAAFAKELVDLLLGRVEGEVADVEGCGVLQLFHGVWRGGAVGGVAALALVLVVGVSEGGRLEVGVVVLVAVETLLPLLWRMRRGGPVARLCCPCGIEALCMVCGFAPMLYGGDVGIVAN